MIASKLGLNNRTSASLDYQVVIPTWVLSNNLVYPQGLWSQRLHYHSSSSDSQPKAELKNSICHQDMQPFPQLETPPSECTS